MLNAYDLSSSVRSGGSPVRNRFTLIALENPAGQHFPALAGMPGRRKGAPIMSIIKENM